MLPSRLRVPLVVGLIVFLLHLAGNPHYGFFRDELYFIICGQHPQFGYVDQPPLAPLLAAGSQVFGPSLLLLRSTPAFFAGLGAFATCLLVLELGGGVAAQAIASMAFFFCPVLMNFGMKVSPDMVGLGLWPLLTYGVLRLARGADPRAWLAVGAGLGVCLQSKHSVLFFAGAMVGGLLLTPERRILLTRWFAAGTLVAAAIALPNLVWQAVHAFPMLEILRNAQQGKNVMLSPAQYLIQQVIITGMLLSGVWMLGLAWLLWNARTRFLGYAFAILAALMIILHGKSYYAASSYACLMAAGGVALEAWTRGSRASRAVALAGVFLAGVVLVPFGMPVLPETQMAAYQQRWMAAVHIEQKTIATAHIRTGALGSDYSDMHGWPELAATVGRVCQSLPASDRARAFVLAQNYGEAAAVEFFGMPYAMPPVISGHNEYFLWGPQGWTGEVVVCVGGNCEGYAPHFRSRELAAIFTAPWIQPDEDGIPIIVYRGLKVPVAEGWPRIKLYL